jgi:hypothetical protein
MNKDNIIQIGIIIVTILFAFVGGLAFGYKLKDDSTDLVEAIAKNDELASRLEVQEIANDYCIKDLTDEMMLNSRFRGLDTNGLSCSEVIEHLNNKYKADISNNELQLKFIERNYKLMEDYISEYYHRTNDSTALNLWRKMNEH